jgi:hypothetical protein
MPIVLVGSLSLLFISGIFSFKGLKFEYVDEDYLTTTILPIIKDYFDKMYERIKLIFFFFEGMFAWGYHLYQDKYYIRFTIFDLNKTPYNSEKNFVDYTNENDFYLDVIIPFEYNDTDENNLEIFQKAGIKQWGSHIYDKFGEVSVQYELPKFETIEEKKVESYKLFKEKNLNLKKLITSFLLKDYTVEFFQEDNIDDSNGLFTEYIVSNNLKKYHFKISLNSQGDYFETFEEIDLVNNTENSSDVIPSYFVQADVVHKGWEKEQEQIQIQEVTGDVALKLSSDSVLKVDVSDFANAFVRLDTENSKLKIDETSKVKLDENSKVLVDVADRTLPISVPSDARVSVDVADRTLPISVPSDAKVSVDVADKTLPINIPPSAKVSVDVADRTLPISVPSDARVSVDVADKTLPINIPPSAKVSVDVADKTLPISIPSDAKVSVDVTDKTLPISVPSDAKVSVDTEGKTIALEGGAITVDNINFNADLSNLENAINNLRDDELISIQKEVLENEKIKHDIEYGEQGIRFEEKVLASNINNVDYNSKIYLYELADGSSIELYYGYKHNMIHKIERELEQKIQQKAQNGADILEANHEINFDNKLNIDKNNSGLGIGSIEAGEELDDYKIHESIVDAFYDIDDLEKDVNIDLKK